MRDIVYRKVGQTSRPLSEQGGEAFPASTASPKRQKAPSKVRSFFMVAGHFLNRVGGLMRQVAEGGQPAVITPVHLAPVAVGRAPLTKKPRRKLRLSPAARAAGQRLAHHSKEKVRSAGHALKTPTGRLATLNALAILAVVGYVSYNHPTQIKTTAQQQVATSRVAADSVRQYLPIAGLAAPSSPDAHAAVSQSQGRTPQLNAWITPWNSDQLASQLSSYKTISAFWLTLDANGYDLNPKADWKQWDSFEAAHKVDGQKVYLTISADPNISIKMLSDSAVQEKHITNLLQTVKSHNFDGIDIDYEGLGSTNSDLFTNFIRALSAAFHNENKLVAVTVEARLNNQVPMDWHNLGLLSDEIRVMAYDYHSHTTNFPGPIAPLGWVKEILDYAVANVDPQKVVIGLGNYGYDWTQKADGSGWEGVGLSYDQATNLAKEKKAQVLLATGIDDRGYEIGNSPMFTYTDDQGTQHSVWFEDQQSLQNKTDLVSQYPVRGIIFWSVGLGDQTFWQNSTTH